jgi:hypothetical protein
MPYDSNINWPQTIDSFPSLDDNQGPSINTNQILYAEHYNKIGNFIRRAQYAYNHTTVASGDGTIKTMYFPSDPTTMGFAIPLPVVARIVCPWAYDSRSTGTNIPGNVLPFEFILSTNTGIVIPWQTDDYSMSQQNSSATNLNQFLNGYSFLSYPRIHVSLWNNSAIYGQFIHYCNQTLLLNSWSIMGSDTLLVRGTVIDMGSDPTDGQERWELYPDYSLLCVFQGVRSG